MKNIFLLLTFFLAINANAAIINLETRALEYTGIAPDYLASWNNHTSSITSSSLSDFTNVDTGNTTFAHLEISFDLGSADFISFDYGLDAGHGAAIYFNNSLVTQDSTDLWWQGNYNHSDVLTTTFNPLATGMNTVDVYWGETFNSGNQSIRFTTDGQNYQNLSVANLEEAKVPEPSILALLGLGLFGLGFMKRKNK